MLQVRLLLVSVGTDRVDRIDVSVDDTRVDLTQTGKLKSITTPIRSLPRVTTTEYFVSLKGCESRTMQFSRCIASASIYAIFPFFSLFSFPRIIRCSVRAIRALFTWRIISADLFLHESKVMTTVTIVIIIEALTLSRRGEYASVHSRFNANLIVSIVIVITADLYGNKSAGITR